MDFVPLDLARVDRVESLVIEEVAKSLDASHVPGVGGRTVLVLDRAPRLELLVHEVREARSMRPLGDWVHSCRELNLSDCFGL